MSVISNPSPRSRGARWQSIRSLLGIGSPADWLFRQIAQSSALLVLVLVVLIVALLTLQAWPAIRGLGVSMVASSDWDPTHHHFGGLAFLYGSVVTSLLAMLLAAPLGVGTATFLAEAAPDWLRRGGSFLVELLAAIPSVVYGFWGIYFLAPNVQKLFNLLGGPNVGGKGLFSASLILAIMIVPYIAAVAFDVCRAVPRAQREGALALGATRWQTIWGVVLPYARSGILGGCFLALGRAVGETMAVTMLIGNTPIVEMLPFGRGYTIPSLLAQKLPSSGSLMEDAALIELSLLLFVLTILMNGLARVLIWRVGHPAPTKQGVGTRFLSGLGRRSAYTRELRGTRKRVPTPFFVDHLMTGVLALCLVLTCIPLFLILGYIAYRGAGALNGDFFTKLPRPQGETGGGLANALVGSGILVGMATLIALPLGLLSAIFLSENRTSRLARVVRFFGELLGGVPSIVIGTFVYAFVRLFIQAGILPPRQQFSGWAGAFALAILMAPIFMRASEEALKLVPPTLRNASYALGAHQWQTVVRVIVPAALPAIITGAFLAIARIAGETAPLLMTAFGNDRWVFTPGDKMGFLPLYIYQYSMSGDPIFEKQAWAAALVLLAFVMLLNVGIRLLTGKRIVHASRAE
ncbi:MAG: phosphate ABC transporter permease subunit PstC [Gemmataceae bacterium]